MKHHRQYYLLLVLNLLVSCVISHSALPFRCKGFRCFWPVGDYCSSNIRQSSSFVDPIANGSSRMMGKLKQSSRPQRRVLSSPSRHLRCSSDDNDHNDQQENKSSPPLGAMDIASFAIRQSPSSTQFITNKMCPFAHKAWIALEASRCPYELKEISLYGPGGKPDWFWELSPDGTVPILTCFGGAMVLPDSDLILDALGEGTVVETGNKGVDLYGKSDEDRDTVAEWRKIVKEEIIPVGKAAVLGRSKPRQRDLQVLLKKLDVMVVGPYLAGESITLADCAAFPFLWRIDSEFGLEEPNLKAWIEFCQTNEVFKKTVPKEGWWWWW